MCLTSSRIPPSAMTGTCGASSAMLTRSLLTLRRRAALPGEALGRIIVIIRCERFQANPLGRERISDSAHVGNVGTRIISANSAGQDDGFQAHLT